MIHADLPSIRITDFRGEQNYLEDSDVPIPFGLTANNLEFRPGQIRSRKAFKEELVAVYSYRKIDHVLFGGTSFLFYLTSNNDIRARLIGSSFEAVLITGISTEAFQGTEFLSRYFFVPIGVDGSSAGAPYSWEGLLLANQVFPLFQGPMTTANLAVNISEPGGTGVVAAGPHNIGVILTAKNGFEGYPSPVNGTVFTPTNFVSAGNKKLTVTLDPTGTWPDWVGYAQVIMTPASNSLDYHKVGELTAVPAGTGNVVITIDVTDAGVRAADSASLNFDLVTSLGGLPLSVKYMTPFGQRMAYTVAINARTAMMFSEVGKPQQITLSKHLIEAPSAASSLVGGLEVGGVYVALAETSTYGVSDSGGFPATWGTPLTISDTIGTPSPFGFAAVNTQTEAWMVVANSKGLWLYKGSYGQLPLSFYQTSDWEQIVWTAPGLVRVSINAQAKLVYVLAPWKDGTTRLMVWDYTNGLEAAKNNYCKYSITGYAPKDLALVRDDTKVWTLLLSSNTPQTLIQRTPGDINLYQDPNSAIIPEWKSTPYPPSMDSAYYAFVMLFLRALGQGTLTVNLKGLDDVEEYQMVPDITLAVKPGKGMFRTVDITSQRCTLDIRLGSPANGDYMVLSYLELFFNVISEMD